MAEQPAERESGAPATPQFVGQLLDPGFQVGHNPDQKVVMVAPVWPGGQLSMILTLDRAKELQAILSKSIASCESGIIAATPADVPPLRGNGREIVGHR